MHPTRMAVPRWAGGAAMAAALLLAPQHPAAGQDDDPSAADADSVAAAEVIGVAQAYYESAVADAGGYLPVYDQYQAETIQVLRIEADAVVHQTGEREYAVGMVAQTEDGQEYGLDFLVEGRVGAAESEEAEEPGALKVARVAIQRGPDGERYAWKRGEDGYWIRQYGTGDGVSDDGGEETP
ncbi:MAG: hypothetical protein AB1505_06035 [Candidatus Latescibacterota bacterium]